MTDISSFIYKDGDKFYFDPENYTGDSSKSLSIEYEDGDMIRWSWKDESYIGVLREDLTNVKLFNIENVKRV
jgi:hypothetical protein